jgi:hypothetical protein
MFALSAIRLSSDVPSIRTAIDEPQYMAEQGRISNKFCDDPSASLRYLLGLISRRLQASMTERMALAPKPRQQAGQITREDSTCKLESTSKEERHHETGMNRKRAYGKGRLE